jgi:hypothetical protein
VRCSKVKIEFRGQSAQAVSTVIRLAMRSRCLKLRLCCGTETGQLRDEARTSVRERSLLPAEPAGEPKQVERRPQGRTAVLFNILLVSITSWRVAAEAS